jgi:hypothetical protein
MEKSSKFWRTANPVLLITYYAGSISLFFVFRKISPTNLAGPGLDLPFLLLLWVFWILFFVYAARRIFKKDKKYFLPFFIHTFAFVALFIVGTIG